MSLALVGYDYNKFVPWRRHQGEPHTSLQETAITFGAPYGFLTCLETMKTKEDANVLSTFLRLIKSDTRESSHALMRILTGTLIVPAAIHAGGIAVLAGAAFLSG